MLHLHRSDRADGLVDALADMLAMPPPDPFAPELVSVPTRGMERWIAQQLSERIGVCANVQFPPPRRLVGDAVAAACGVDPDEDPWLPERAVWPLLDVVDECLHEHWLRRLANHLDGPLKRGRRFAVVRHVVDLFDGYALHRPEMVRAWAASASAANGHWQGQLWRCLRERIGQPGPAERLEEAAHALARDRDAVELPERVSIFGLTRMPIGYREIVEALAAQRDVHLFLLHPSPALWQRVGATRATTPKRKEDPTADAATNRLLASWARDAREMQVVLTKAEHEDHHHETERPGDTLLRRIQRSVRDDEDADPGAADDSVVIHACHGRARQVETLRHAILHALQADPTLEPRDVIVMCPDIETFAPLVHATFGATAPDDEHDDDNTTIEGAAPDLRVRLADRSLKQTNPVLGVIGQLLELAEGRTTASEVLDLASREPVRKRFRFDDDALARLEEWVGESGIRWGLDAPGRASFKLQNVDEGTWRRGLDRVLVGVTMTETERRLVSNVLPLDDVDSGAIDLAGRLAELIDRLASTLGAMQGEKTLDEWTQTLSEAADLLTATSERDAWQRTELDRMLEQFEHTAATAQTKLVLPEIRALLHDRLQGRPTRANFRTGHLTFCTLVPMRSIPHRVVCLLGLDDGVFPRKAPKDGDDLRLDDPHVGERDPRAEDRQLLLDALMAAQDKLIITYTGNDERTNAERPPAVPVGELLDVIGRDNRDRVLVRHPLQPFAPRNFEPGELVASEPWSFDHVTLAGAQNLTQDTRPDPPPFLPERLARRHAPAVALDDVLRFVQHPVKAFLRQRLTVSVGDWSTETADSLPVELSGLEKWDVGQRMLAARLAGCDPRAVTLSEIARGHLPPGVLRWPVINELYPVVEGIVAQVDQLLGDTPAEPKDVRIPLPDGRVLTGTVSGLRGDAVETTTFSRVGPKQRLTAWVRTLALAAAHEPRRAVTIGRGSEDRVAVVEIPPPHPGEALALLAQIVDLHDRGMREPLPLACKTSAVYAQARTHGGDARRAASTAWETDRFSPENAEPEHVLAFRGHLSWDELVGTPPEDDERGHGWDPEEPSRFGRLAMRLWTPLLDVEERREL